MRTYKIYPFGNFQTRSTVLLTVVAMPCITPPGLPYFIPGRLYLLTPFTDFTYSPSPSLDTTQI